MKGRNCNDKSGSIKNNIESSIFVEIYRDENIEVFIKICRNLDPGK